MTSFKLEQDIPAAHSCDPAHEHECFYLEAVLDPATHEEDLQDFASLLLTRAQSGACKRSVAKLDRVLNEALLTDEASRRQKILGHLFLGLAGQTGTPHRKLDLLYRKASLCEPASYLERLLAGSYLSAVQTLPEAERRLELARTARHAPRNSSLSSESKRLLGQQSCALSARLGG